ncbi:glucose 1-dehydrogenase [Paenibacillus sp. JCM 10914]|uniref:glucose 1-dehydrogenase n=1 Tax=Paenibacillus sp. JCM 10914 TaxID=1236974 RepID=UPI0003CC5FC7|nr:glucose 1-dehydrogenase [Paenibacillus sp. JCM 10914]GAE06250.1 glutamate synthase [Paenibacillus sp. JCM 10914]
MGKLTGKVAIVTGASRGQGAAHVRALVEEGAKVALTDIQVELGEALAKELGERALFIQHDVSNPADWERVVAQAETAFGPVNVLVNNAGIAFLKEIKDTTFEEYQRVININQASVFLGMKSVLPSMRRAGVGSIINVSSAAGDKGIPGNVAYGATKFAIRGMSKVAALEFTPYNIRVNTIMPGVIQTPMVDDPEADRVSEIVKGIPMQRLGKPEEVANLVVYLASDDSSYSTGADFVVDGGFLV